MYVSFVLYMSIKACHKRLDYGSVLCVSDKEMFMILYHHVYKIFNMIILRKFIESIL